MIRKILLLSALAFCCAQAKADRIPTRTVSFYGLPANITSIQLCQDARILEPHFVTCLPIYNRSFEPIQITINNYLNIQNTVVNPGDALVIGTNDGDDEHQPIMIDGKNLGYVVHDTFKRTSPENNIGVICRKHTDDNDGNRQKSAICTIWKHAAG